MRMFSTLSSHKFLEQLSFGNIEKMKQLIDKQEVNFKKLDQEFGLLAYALDKNRFLDTIQFLADQGADLDQPKSKPDQATPLMIASRKGDLILMRFLLDKGAKINAVDLDGYTALMWVANSAPALTFCHALRLLLNMGADPNIKSNTGVTALHLLNWKDRAEAVDILIEAGANPTIQKHDGQTPYQHAVSKNAGACQEALKHHEERQVLQSSTVALKQSAVHQRRL
jgi:ankyrin repeat protein